MDRKIILSPRFGGRHAQNQDMKLLLSEAHMLPGLKRGHWPDLGLPPTVVQGIEVWVEPIVRVPGHKSSKHRVKCRCPKCSMVLSVGRLHQHVC